MSTLGKILLVFNLLAGIAVFVLVPMHYAKQRSWTYAVYLYDQRIQGIPADNDEKDAEGNPRLDKFTKAVANDVFQGLGAPVLTQKEEVARVRGLLQQKIDGAEGPLTKEQRLARVLLPFARAYSEREALLRRAADNKANKFDDLEADFAKLFDDAVAPGRAADVRKQAVAHLLFGVADVLNEDQAVADPNANPDAFASNVYKRFLVVVGLGAAVREIDARASALQGLAADAGTQIGLDRGAFVEHHARLIYEAQNAAEDLQRQKEFLGNANREAAQQEAIRDARATEVMKLKQEYDQLRKDTQGRLGEQAAREQELFERLKKVRDAMKKNEDLEKDLRRLESGS